MKEKKDKIKELKRDKRRAEYHIRTISLENDKINEEQLNICSKINKLKLLKDGIEKYKKKENKEKLVAIIISILPTLAVLIATSNIIPSLIVLPLSTSVGFSGYIRSKIFIKHNNIDNINNEITELNKHYELNEKTKGINNDYIKELEKNIESISKEINELLLGMSNNKYIRKDIVNEAVNAEVYNDMNFNYKSKQKKKSIIKNN